MTTIYDIAKRCNLSAATVSKALQDKPDISAKTKQRIMAVAKELKYVPNRSAATLTTKRSYTIGVVYDESSFRGLSHDFFSGILESIRLNSNQRHYDVMFLINDSSNNPDTYIHHCKSKQLDGIIIVCADFASASIIALTKSEIPVVCIDADMHRASGIYSNNRQGMELLLNYIIECGHTEIGYIHGQIGAAATKPRLETFYRVMNEHHIKIHEEWILEGAYYNPLITNRVMRKLLSQPPLPTALLFPDDFTAAAFYQIAPEYRLSIPDDLSIAGFDGIFLSNFLNPRLTTVYQDCSQIGKFAVQNLLSIIEDKKSPNNIVIDTSLIKGESIKKMKYK